MNIVHVVENLNRGGLERMVIDLVSMQQRQGQAEQGHVQRISAQLLSQPEE